ncbi:MAG: diguanylate cyclase [Spirochaetaceae bacterium]|nr:diguanylate cyclase [Spirochaetaceae bacterium]
MPKPPTGRPGGPLATVLPAALLLLAIGGSLGSCSSRLVPLAPAAVRAGRVAAPGSGSIRLDGEWRFSPGLFFVGGAEEAETLFARGEGHYLKVPGVWNGLQPAFGRGTYQTAIEGLEPGRLYALQFKGLSSRAEIRADGRLLGAWGERGVHYLPTSYYFTPRDSTTLLSVSVENRLFSTGGIWYPVVFGGIEGVDRSAQAARFIDIALFGGILLMAIYHLGLFFHRPKEKAPLYFSLFCLLGVAKAGLSGEQILFFLFPRLDQGLGLRMAYLLTVAMPLAFLAYIQAIYPTRRHAVVGAGLAALGLPMVLLAAAAPYHLLQTWFWPYQVAIAAASAHVVAVVLGALRRREPGAGLMLAGFVVLVAAAANDILHDNKIIVTFYAMNAGLIGFLLVQALVMGGMFSRAFLQIEELNESLEGKVAARTRELEELSRVDALTGLLNRRHFWTILNGEWERLRRYGQDFALALVDLDHFKEINDSRGHAAGDEALRRMAAFLSQSVRATDRVARYGGEEFCLLFPNTGAEEAGVAMEKARSRAAAELGFTFSYGVAQASRHGGAEDLVKAADDLMYAAKAAGRNRGATEADAAAKGDA